MSVLLHISDTHFGTERPAVVDALLALAGALQPCQVVLSGDITQRARSRQFAAARRFVEQLPAPVLSIPGNHDIPLFDLWRRWRAPYSRYCLAFGPVLEPEWSHPDWMVLSVNTTRWWRHKDGEVSLAQVEEVARRLRQANRQQLRVVVTHQPMAVTRPEDESNLLHGHALAARIWSDAGADMVLGGHIHLPYVRRVHGAHTSRALWVVQAGTAVSHRLRAGISNSVNVIRRGAAPRTCQVERWDFDEGSGVFARVDTQSLELDPV